MGTILKRCNGYQAFETEWKDKWAPAIVEYSRQVKRKDIKEALTAVPQDDEDGKHKISLLYWFEAFFIHCTK